MDESAVVHKAGQQHGLITLDQARALGIGSRRVRTRVENGAWKRVRTGVYIVGAAPRSWEQGVAAAVLEGGDGTYASHRTAAQLWGLVQRSGRIEVLTHTSRRLRLAGVTAHRSLLIDERDHTTRNGIPTTTIERTIVDLAHAGDATVIGRWIDTGLRTGTLDLARLIEFTGRLARPGRGIPHTVIDAVALRRPGFDPGRSALESRAIEALARAGLPEPVRQFPVIRPDGRQAFIDLAYPHLPLAIELDGYETHGTRAAFEDDRLRGNDLVLLGWPVLRFTWAMSDRYFCQTVDRALRAAA